MSLVKVNTLHKLSSCLVAKLKSAGIQTEMTAFPNQLGSCVVSMAPQPSLRGHREGHKFVAADGRQKTMASMQQQIQQEDDIEFGGPGPGASGMNAPGGVEAEKCALLDEGEGEAVHLAFPVEKEKAGGKVQCGWNGDSQGSF
ncbi:hypothetical protein CPB86DRAFT_830586 [Serendipita vermifera]|nr:hypothetical protein CPB86DRAFT_830586 [Serendipita vermifera]